ncbi:hypothetical protein PoB_000225400 [Plakobranchus ocellatus]|uniref:Uncharacterized protein n=1 Tax=Plakobranchus ocellatus TaxID=259542 RepID=A0AAV3XY18_9GAST|nr:hypothetical protein PoB_000225400 [Plakobranchus ocellatus]
MKPIHPSYRAGRPGHDRARLFLRDISSEEKICFKEPRNCFAFSPEIFGHLRDGVRGRFQSCNISGRSGATYKFPKISEGKGIWGCPGPAGMLYNTPY